MNFGFDLDYCRRVRAAGRRVVTADVRAIYHHALALDRRPRPLGQAHVQLAERWATATGRLGAAGATSRGRTRGGASNRIHAHARGRDAHPGAGASHGRGNRHAVWRLTAPLRRINRWRAAAVRRLPSPARGGSRPSRPRQPVAIPARTRSRESRSATAKALDPGAGAAPPPDVRPAAPPSRSRLAAMAQRDVVHPVLLQPREQAAVIPRREDARDRVRPRRAGVPRHAEAEERGHDHQAQVRARGREVLDRREHAVARAASGGGARVGQAVRAESGLAGEQAAVGAGHAVPKPRGSACVEVVVPAPVRPADVVEEQQRERRVRRALADELQLPRTVSGCGRRRSRRRRGSGSQGEPRGWSADQLELGALLIELDEPVLRSRIDGADARPRAPAQSTRKRVRSPANAPTSTTKRAPAASRHGRMMSAMCAMDTPQRFGSLL